MDEKSLPSVLNTSSSEDFPGLSDKPVWINFLRDNILIFTFGLLGFIFLLAGIFALSSKNEEPGIIFEDGMSIAQGKIKVDIEGAVVKPGVYELDSDGRIQDALILAGGLSSSADREWVAKNLNLAAKLTDGAKIYIPESGGKTEGGIRDQASPRDSARGELGITGEVVGEKININTASIADLDRLPGVGPVTAQKIISGRPYQSIDDLISKKIIGSSVFSKIKDQLVLW